MVIENFHIFLVVAAALPTITYVIGYYHGKFNVLIDQKIKKDGDKD